MTVPQLNEILARELHRVPGSSNEGIFAWSWSEDLFWPAYATGGRVEKTTPSGLVYFEPEYRRDRMSHKLRDQWVITKWCAPETLDRWQQNFPGAPYPGNGFRINTDWYNKPGVLPSEADTNCFIHNIREQMSKNRAQLDNEMAEEHDKAEKSVDNQREDAVEDSFGAYLNPKPGSRGGHVSMPYTDKERKEALITNG